MLVGMGKHREHKEHRRGLSLFRRRHQPDNLFERSFRACSRCGEDVYVLAEDCRECGQVLELTAG